MRHPTLCHTKHALLGKVKSVFVALPSNQQNSYTWQQVYFTEEFFSRPHVNQFQPAATLILNTSEKPHRSRSSGGDASGILSPLCITKELGCIGAIQTAILSHARFKGNLYYSPFFVSRLILHSSCLFSNHTCYNGTGNNTDVSQSADDLACCKALARKHHRDFLLLITGLVGGWMKQWARPAWQRETCQLYTGKIYMFWGSNSKTDASHQACWGYNSAAVIQSEIQHCTRWPILQCKKLNWGCHVYLIPLQQYNYTHSRHPKQPNRTWHPWQWCLLCTSSHILKPSVLVTHCANNSCSMIFKMEMWWYWQKM